MSFNGLFTLWYIYTMDCYSARKRYKGLIHATTWTGPKGIMLSDKKGYIYKYTAFLKGHMIELENMLVVARG